MSEPAIDLHVEKVVTSTPNFTPVGYLFFLDPITYRIEVTNTASLTPPTCSSRRSSTRP